MSVAEAYDPKDDVKRVADYLKNRYGDLENALKNLDPDGEFDLYTFEAVLKKWGVQVDSVVELFGHIDFDWSGAISVHELFEVLELPMKEAQEREEERRNNEVSRIYEQLAKSIRHKFGSIADYFAKEALKQGTAAEGGHGEISKGRFRGLLKDLGIDLDATQAQRVFSKIDKNASGSVSMQELQQALNFNLVRDILSEFAGHLLEKHQSVIKPFEELGEIPGSLASVGASATSVPPLPAFNADAPMVHTPSSTSIMKQGEVTEVNFLRILGRLDIMDKLTEETAKQLYASLRPFTIPQLVDSLKSAEAERRNTKRREQEAQKHKRDQQRRAARAFNSRLRAEDDVRSWAEKRADDSAAVAASMELVSSEPLHPGVARLPGGMIEDATRDWAMAARAGISKAQLKDYISVLEERLDGEEQDLDLLRGNIQKKEEDAEALRDYMGFAGQSHIPGRSASDVSPASPCTPYTPFLTQTPGSRMGTTTPRTPKGALPVGALSQVDRTTRSERLIQAASAGDVAAAQRLIALKTDPNCAGWGGVTPLMAAAHHGRQALLETLLARQADLLRTDVRGRTALDHAHRRPAVREWLRACGGRAGRELAAEAEALARRVLLAGAERARLEALRAKLPSEDVLRQARLRRQLADPTPGAPFGGAAGRPAWPAWSPGASVSPEPSPYAASSPAPTPHPPSSCLSARSAGRGEGRGRPERHVNIMLPEEAVRLMPPRQPSMYRSETT